MRAVPTALQAKLDTGATTLCRCWVLTRRDGAVEGFTDHDADIAFDAVTCRAGTGLNASEATQELGLAVTAAEVSGVLADDSLREADLAAGRYDAASVDVWLVDWSEPSLRLLLSRGTLGEVRREGTAFTAEIRGLSDRLAEETGRIYTATCDADLGDARCTLDLSAPEFRGEGTLDAVTATSSFAASGLDVYDDGWFTAGRLVWVNGANAGLAIEVKTHRVDIDGVTLALWQAMPEPIAEGDTFVVTAGCDKSFTTCRDRFANVVNFRGFPQIPGNDFIVRYANSGEPGNDGASLGQAI
jgi:uncharacterized phage protein (TIGR02218 family)